MKPFRRIACWILIALTGPAQAGDPTALNETPRHPPLRLQLEEVWRTGDRDGVVLGAPVGLAMDDQGVVVVCDHQLASLFAVGPGAEKLGVLARSGEGPGELGMPMALAAWPGGGFGVAEFFPGRITRVTAAGEPAGSILIDPTPEEEGGFTLLTSLAVGGANVVVSGFNQAPAEDGIRRNDFLAAVGQDGGLLVRYVDRQVTLSPAAEVVRESEYLARFHLAHAVAPDGRVLVAPDPDRYRIEIYYPDGQQAGILERPHVVRKRTPRESRLIEALFEAWNSSRPAPPRVEIEKTAPAVEDLQVDGRGRIWVRHAGSGPSDQPGVFLVLDQFSPAGDWLREVAFVCPGDPVLDGLVVLDSERVLVIRHDRLSRLTRFAAIAGRAPTYGVEGEQRPLEIICYRVPGGLPD